MIPELVTIHTSLLTDLGDAIRERFGVSGDLTIEEMTDVVKGRLPSGYTEMPWIQSSGTQWINTGVIAGQNTEFEAKVSSLTNSNGATIIGNESGNGTSKYSALLWNNNWYINKGNSGSQGIAFASSDYYTISYKNGKFSINSNEVSFTNTLINTVGALALLAKRIGTSHIEGSTYMNARLHYTKIWDSGTLIRNFIPCIRTSDSVAGLYDTVGGQFYTNAGTGTFITP
jgi:hypothetical protein